MLSLQKKNIKKLLFSQNILEDVDDTIERLVENNKLNEFMTTDTIYSVFMINLSEKHPVFKRLLNKNYLFDFEIKFIKNENSKLKKKECLYDVVDFEEEEYDKQVKNNQNSHCKSLRKIIEGKLKVVDYVYVSLINDDYFVGVKYKERLEDYESAQKSLLDLLKTEKVLEGQYKIVYDDKNIKVEKSDLKNKYEELVAHIKSIKLPLQVVDDDCPGLDTTYQDFINVYIHLEYSDKWPQDAYAVDYAKTAFYCEIYKRSKFRHFVDEDSVVLKYKDFYFKVVIVEEQRKELILTKQLYKSINSLLPTLPKIKHNILMVKKYLSSHGYYPYYFNDFLVDVICLGLERIDCPSRFLREFLQCSFDFIKLNVDTLETQENTINRFTIYRKLDNFYLDLPEANVLKRLKLLNKLQLKGCYNLLQPNYKDFDFCLSYTPKEGFELVCKETSAYKFLDYKILNRIEVRRRAFVFYSAPENIVMIKCREGVDVRSLLYYLLSTTSYKYLLMNKI